MTATDPIGDNNALKTPRPVLREGGQGEENQENNERFYSKERVQEYVKERLFGTTINPDEIRRIIIENGLLPSATRKKIVASNGIGELLEHYDVEQANTIFFHEGDLFIPQYYGNSRRRFYERLITAYNHATKRNIPLESGEVSGSPRATYLAYEQLLQNVIHGLFYQKNDETKRGFKRRNIQDITTILLNSPPSKEQKMFGNSPMQGTSEYVQETIYDISGKKVLSLNMPPGDHQEKFLNQLLLEYDAHAKACGKKQTLNIYKISEGIGTARGLDPEELIIPRAYLPLGELRPMDDRYPLKNSFVDKQCKEGLVVVADSWLDITQRHLKTAKINGHACFTTDLFDIIKGVERARGDYDALDIKFYAACYLTEVPLREEISEKDVPPLFFKIESERLRRIIPGSGKKRAYDLLLNLL